jgi:tetratricopeptide (TPR) repeat protein
MSMLGGKLPIMSRLLVTVFVFIGLSALAQTQPDGNFKLVLPDHRGQLRWSADGFKIVQSSAKPNGREIGIRGQNQSRHLNFLGFLFLVPEQAPLTSDKCRDGAIKSERQSNQTLRMLQAAGSVQAGLVPVSLVTYTALGDSGKKVYIVRGFVATGDICGDLEFYGDSPISAEDADLKKTFASYQLDENYPPTFGDVFLYAQMLYNTGMYKAAAPMFEEALAKLNESTGIETKTMRRVATDQAGMSYGMSGDIPKARIIFERAVAEDPDYPIYYYNLACADAEEKNLTGARNHLQQAFDRKANVIVGERMPDPTTDDSFLPYRNEKEFWTFLLSLRQKQ